MAIGQLPLSTKLAPAIAPLQDATQAETAAQQPAVLTTTTACGALQEEQKQTLEQQQPQAPPLPPQQLWQRPEHATLPAAAHAILYPAAVLAPPGSPSGGPVIHQYFASPPSLPAHAAQPAQQQLLGAASGPADTEWQSRPASAGSSYSLHWQAAGYMLPGPALLAPMQSHVQPTGGVQGTGQGAASTGQRASQPAVQCQRPPTSGTGLACERLASNEPAGRKLGAGAKAARSASTSARVSVPWRRYNLQQVGACGQKCSRPHASHCNACGVLQVEAGEGHL